MQLQLRNLVGLSTLAVLLARSTPASAQSSKFIQNMDVNKDGKVSRDEMPEGSAARRIFDGFMEKWKLDPKKSYTLAELEQASGLGASGTGSTSSSATPGSFSPGRFGSPRRGPTRSGPTTRTPSDGRPFRALEEVPDPYRSYDKDGDGQVGLYEWPRDRIRDFIALDANDDGFLTVNELRRPGESSSSSSTRESPKKDDSKKDEPDTTAQDSAN